MFIWNHEDWLMAYPKGLQPNAMELPGRRKKGVATGTGTLAL
jgi:hypothetical protein